VSPVPSSAASLPPVAGNTPHRRTPGLEAQALVRRLSLQKQVLAPEVAAALDDFEGIENGRKEGGGAEG
jgi:hypothetical protein